jgi:hypothetical protein
MTSAPEVGVENEMLGQTPERVRIAHDQFAGSRQAVHPLFRPADERRKINREEVCSGPAHGSQPRSLSIA